MIQVMFGWNVFSVTTTPGSQCKRSARLHVRTAGHKMCRLRKAPAGQPLTDRKVSMGSGAGLCAGESSAQTVTEKVFPAGQVRRIRILHGYVK